MRKVQELTKLTAEILKQSYMQYKMPDTLIMILTGDINNVVELQTAMLQLDNVIKLDDELHVDYALEIPVHRMDSLYNVFKRYRLFQREHIEDCYVDYDYDLDSDIVPMVFENKEFETLIETLQINDEAIFMNYMMFRLSIVLKSIMACSKYPQYTCSEMVKMGYNIHEVMSKCKTECVYDMLFGVLYNQWKEYLQ